MSEYLERLKLIGADIDGTVARFMGKEDICERIMRKFPDDKSYEQAVLAKESGDDEMAMKMIHTLKGVASNLGFIPIYEITADMMDNFRSGQTDKAYARFPELKEKYDLYIKTMTE